MFCHSLNFSIQYNKSYHEYNKIFHTKVKKKKNLQVIKNVE